VFYGGTPKLPKPTARQLSLYLKELEARKDAKLLSINSSQLGEALGLTRAGSKGICNLWTVGKPVLVTQLHRYVNSFVRLLVPTKRVMLRLLAPVKLDRQLVRIQNSLIVDLR